MYLNHHQLKSRDDSAMRRLPGNVIIGDSTAAHDLRQMVALAAGSDGPLLLTGPAGCGKKVAARAIYAASPQRNHPLITVNIAALAKTNATEMLFGIGAGRRSGAHPPSLYERAQGGILLFEEIADLSLECQALLQQLLNGAKIPGMPPALKHGSTEHAATVRIIAASSQCLASKIGEVRFRQDLYYQLSRLSIHVPPLRQRREDIPALIDYFLMEHPAAQRFTMNGAALQMLEAYPWPGNIHELRNLVARACLFHPGRLLGARRMTALLHMGQPLRSRARRPGKGDNLVGIGPGFNLKAYLDDEELRFIQSALQQAGGVVQHAADLSGLKRTTFIEKMKRHGIDRADYKKWRI